MKLTALLLLSSVALGQTAPKPATTTTTTKPASSTAAKPGTATHTAAATHPCSKLPVLSPKIPALPAGSPCAKPLYSITTVPGARMDYVSPVEPADLAEVFGLKPVTFSLDYVDTKVGTGALITAHKWCTLNYTGYLADGTKFDSSFDHPDPFTIAYGQHQAIPGMDTGLDGMRVGGKRRLFVPFELAYSTRGNPPTIPPKADLIFDVELVSISDHAPAPKAPPTPPAAPASQNPAAPGATPATPATPPAASTPPAATVPSAPASPPASAAPPAQATPAAPPNPPKPQ
jgi:peptidylprolyl isomerase